MVFLYVDKMQEEERKEAIKKAGRAAGAVAAGGAYWKSARDYQILKNADDDRKGFYDDLRRKKEAAFKEYKAKRGGDASMDSWLKGEGKSHTNIRAKANKYNDFIEKRDKVKFVDTRGDHKKAIFKNRFRHLYRNLPLINRARLPRILTRV